jgi:hypothetical protein
MTSTEFAQQLTLHVLGRIINQGNPITAEEDQKRAVKTAIDVSKNYAALIKELDPLFFDDVHVIEKKKAPK